MSQAIVTEELLAEIVRRIAAVADPEQIILFGSHARGEAGPDSDIDLLVVQKTVQNARKESTRIRAALEGILHPFDIIVRTPDYLARRAAVPGTVAHWAAAEGRPIYERKR